MSLPRDYPASDASMRKIAFSPRELRCSQNSNLLNVVDNDKEEPPFSLAHGVQAKRIG